MENATIHSIDIEQCKKITATLIESVDSFSDRQIVLSYANGKIVVVGANMKITSFSKSSGCFSAVGEIISVRYVGKGLSFKGKLFK